MKYFLLLATLLIINTSYASEDRPVSKFTCDVYHSFDNGELYLIYSAINPYLGDTYALDAKNPWTDSFSISQSNNKIFLRIHQKIDITKMKTKVVAESSVGVSAGILNKIGFNLIKNISLTYKSYKIDCSSE